MFFIKLNPSGLNLGPLGLKFYPMKYYTVKKPNDIIVAEFLNKEDAIKFGISLGTKYDKFSNSFDQEYVHNGIKIIRPIAFLEIRNIDFLDLLL